MMQAGNIGELVNLGQFFGTVPRDPPILAPKTGSQWASF